MVANIHNLIAFKRQRLNYESKLRTSGYIEILHARVSYAEKKRFAEVFFIIGLIFHYNTVVEFFVGKPQIMKKK